MADALKFGKFSCSQDEAGFLALLEKLSTHEFKVSKKLTDQAADMALYDIKYYEQRLQMLETMDEGEITVANRIQILRKYVAPKTQTDSTHYDFMTRVQDVTIQQKRGSIVLIHGFAQCSDVWFEAAFQLALNGYIVHFIDLEGNGYCAGNRVSGLAIERFHHQVSTILLQVSADLPCFLLGHSMGSLIVNTYLKLNPAIAEKLAGVIFSAPFFGMAKKIGLLDQLVLGGIAANLDEMVLTGGLQLHKICRNKQFVRTIINNKKANPLLSASLIASFNKHLASVAKNADKVAYPYLLILGEKDVIVDNQKSRDWHQKTVSKTKEIKLMAGSFHELSKEPNNGTMFESVLKFTAKRTAEGAQNFGTLDPKSIVVAKTVPAAVAVSKRRRILVIVYFVIGFLLALFRRSKRLFLIWPAMPFLKH